jgi:hypothetical protein
MFSVGYGLYRCFSWCVLRLKMGVPLLLVVCLQLQRPRFDVRFVVNRVTLGRCFLRDFSLRQCSIRIFIWTLLLPGPTVEVLEPSTKQCSIGNRGELDRKIFHPLKWRIGCKRTLEEQEEQTSTWRWQHKELWQSVKRSTNAGYS